MLLGPTAVAGLRLELMAWCTKLFFPPCHCGLAQSWLTSLQAATGSGRATRSKRQGPGAQAAASTSSSGRQATFFSDTNRLGVPGSLHRISAMRDRAGAVFGLTYRVGRHIPGGWGDMKKL